MTDMILVRESDEGDARHYWVDPTFVRSADAHRNRGTEHPRKPRVWRYGKPVRHPEREGEFYPMLTSPGWAAIGRDVPECMKLIEGEKGRKWTW